LAGKIQFTRPMKQIYIEIRSVGDTFFGRIYKQDTEYNAFWNVCPYGTIKQQNIYHILQRWLHTQV